MYTQLGVLTKGTIIEVNVSELGMVTTGGKVVFGKYAQITNNPENDGCINAVLRESHFLKLFSTSHSCLLPFQSSNRRIITTFLLPGYFANLYPFTIGAIHSSVLLYS